MTKRLTIEWSETSVYRRTFEVPDDWTAELPPDFEVNDEDPLAKVIAEQTGAEVSSRCQDREIIDFEVES